MKLPDIRNTSPSSLFLGIDALYHIRDNALTYYQKLHSDYGDAVKVRLGPYRCWFIFHPNHVEQILAKKSDSFIRFEKIMNILKQWNGESLLIAEGDSWNKRRRKVLPSLTQQRIPNYANLVAKHANDFTDNLMAEINLHGMCDSNIDDDMAQYALDIAGITLFGKKIGSVAEPISEAVKCLSEIAYNETTSPFTLPNFIPSSANRHKKKVIGTMKQFIEEIVSERKNKASGKQQDLLSILMTHHNGDNTAIEEDVISLLIAGHETSGSTLSWLFLLLAKHPNVLQKIQTELDHVLGDEIASYDDLRKLPYLNATIQETMRLYPAAYALFCRRATEDVDIGGAIIKKGELVQFFPYITQRDSRWFKDADRFNPDRFMNEETWPKYAYFPFGAGPRICIGQSFGMMEVALTAAIILKKLSLLPSEPTLKGTPRFSLRPNEGIKITFIQR